MACENVAIFSCNHFPLDDIYRALEEHAPFLLLPDEQLEVMFKTEEMDRYKSLTPAQLKFAMEYETAKESAKFFNVGIDEITTVQWNTLTQIERTAGRDHWRRVGHVSFSCTICGFPSYRGTVGCAACHPSSQENPAGTEKSGGAQ